MGRNVILEDISDFEFEISYYYYFLEFILCHFIF
jgi:hypothetical protein